jgi:hypothetical protein
MVGLLSVTIFALGGVFAAPAAVSSPDYQPQASGRGSFVVQLLRLTAAPVVRSSSVSTTPAATPAVLVATPPTPSPPAVPAPAPAPAPAVPAYGQATVWGCPAALAYLQAYAAPGFALDCPGDAQGHEAMTCIHGTPQYPDACPDGPTIAISDPCPQAYMNEAANSWNLTGQLAVEQQKFGVSYAAIDPFGACP